MILASLLKIVGYIRPGRARYDRAELNLADLTQADLTQGRDDPHSFLRFLSVMHLGELSCR